MKRLNLRLRTRLKLKLIYLLPVLSIVLVALMVVYFNLSQPQKASAATETISSGSFIINMGVTPQTYNNGLKPYGMLYDLLVKYSIPIKWVIEPAKAKDGTDFTYASTAYKGGPFIVPAEYITPAITARITYWTGQGVVGTYTTSAINVPVYATLTNFPKTIIDTVSKNENIIISYYDNALIPSTAYTTGSPSIFSSCHDLWVNPHGDPTWASHGYLYNLATTYKSFIWCQCHSVSVMEGVKNSASPFEQLNFLTTNGLKCYSNNKCGNSTETHGGNATSPFTHNHSSDPVMQFMGSMAGATTGGSENWYQPQSTGSWRPTAKRLVTTSDGTSPGEGVLMVYGPAFGNTNNGYVMYEAGHSLDGSGTTAEKVAAQRAYFNFVLLAGKTKQLVFDSYVAPSLLNSSEAGTVSTSVSSGSPGYSYAWTSSVGGTFSNPSAASTTFTAPYTNVDLNGTITCNVTDACGRKNFSFKALTVKASTLPISLLSFEGECQNNQVKLTWITASEINNDYFEIQRSIDGTTFNPIGQVKGHGNSTVNISYSFIDNDPGQTNNYYRLRQVDFDGRSTTFEPVFIKFSLDYRDGTYKVSPNPFRDNITLSYNSDRQKKVNFSLMNQSGVVAWKQIVLCQVGMNVVNFNYLDELPSGVYYAIILDNEQRRIIKLIKK